MRKLGRFRRVGLSFVPVDKLAREATAAVPEGRWALFEVWKPRNMEQHKAYFAMLDNVVEADGRWPSREALEFDVALALKRGVFVEAFDGSRHFKPDSRAVGSMSKDDFERLHRDTRSLLIDWLKCDPDALMDRAA